MAMTIVFSPEGRLLSLRSAGGVEYAAAEQDGAGLFLLRLRDFVGTNWDVRPRNFRKCAATGDGAGGWRVVWSECGMMPGLEVTATVAVQGESSLWRLEAVLPTADYHVEWTDFPRVALKRHDGETYLLPFVEGCLLEDLRVRQAHSGFKPVTTEFPMTGISSFYPGPCAAQFEAVCGPEGIVYIACRDASHSPKTIDMTPGGDDGAGAVLLLQHFTGGKAAMGYPVEISLLPGGGWEDAAERYRAWMESSDSTLPPKLSERCPEALAQSPVLLMYPVRGHGLDNGDMEFNEYYPYSSALPVVEAYQRKWANPVMALLMHWEGTAPWAPPFVWPPQGGEAPLTDFAEKLHAKGNMLGLYASGIGWTQKSMTDRSFTLEERFRRENVSGEVCRGPRGEAWARCCNGYWAQRIGYDLCPSREYTGKVVSHEVASAASAGVDYMQYFDQVHGGASPLCYSAGHGHPAYPGSWETAAMRKLFAKAGEACGRKSEAMMLGCENGAAEPYLQWCQLNDLRCQLAWGTCAMPVPLYQYLFHEYASGFRGNGVCLSQWIDMEATPFYPRWSLAWHFANGNLLSAVLKDNGKMHWHWELPWSVPGPEQEGVNTLVRRLAALRRGDARCLIAGRMEAAPAVECGTRRIVSRLVGEMDVPAVIASAWRDTANGGGRVVLLVNYNETDERCVVQGREYLVPALDALCLKSDC